MKKRFVLSFVFLVALVLIISGCAKNYDSVTGQFFHNKVGETKIFNGDFFRKNMGNPFKPSYAGTCVVEDYGDKVCESFTHYPDRNKGFNGNKFCAKEGYSQCYNQCFHHPGAYGAPLMEVNCYDNYYFWDNSNPSTSDYVGSIQIVCCESDDIEQDMD